MEMMPMVAAMYASEDQNPSYVQLIVILHSDVSAAPASPFLRSASKHHDARADTA
jgi:hypothetical protein